MTDLVSTTTPPDELPQSHAPFTARFNIHARKDLEKELDVIVGDAITEARRLGTHGILVTRNSPSTFTVELSKAVPYGTITERYLR
ncbi:hypothetical protein [Paenarthrobacter histidinolovorans]|uniref:hypothetical protein n=1 Tax=Paenarthrobacter histidinolovorans TaxID=43664 RepID=UPI001663C396|nr:hypothetical protein [Paenarthrobacter histidinolovorans]GGJ39964.1 hypothetical protein GCM10010052_41400 [Paenarthrobacter histidinolovorans]